MEVTFANPKYLALLLALPLLIFMHFYLLKHSPKKALKFANYEAIRRVTGGETVHKSILILLLRLCIVAFLVLAVTGTTIWYKGLSAKYDMVLAIDASSSMLANDYTPNRLEAAKNAATLFVDRVQGDVKVGITSFSGATFIEKEPTREMKEIKEAIKNIQIHTLGGTDLGQAIITSSNMIREGNAPKVIVLLTDGRSNIGIDPKEAIDRIGKDNVLIYTIGVGTGAGGAIEGVAAAFTVDDLALKEIADLTGGKYFQATSVQALENAFKEIAQVQKKNIKLDISLYLLLFSFFLLFIEWGLISTKYQVI